MSQPFPSPAAPAKPTRQDEEQLNQLGVLYYVYGGLVGLGGAMFGMMGLLPVLVFTAASPPSSSASGPPPWVIGGVFALMFGIAGILLVAKGIVMLFAGHALRTRRNYVLCMVGACLAVMNIPVGTALAVFTFMVMTKPGMKERFETASTA